MDFRFLVTIEAKVRSGAFRKFTDGQKAKLRLALPALGFLEEQVRTALAGGMRGQANLVLKARRRIRDGSLRLGRALVAIDEQRSPREVAKAIAELKDLATRSPVEMYRSQASEALQSLRGRRR